MGRQGSVRAIVVYTVLRVAVFLAVWGVVWLLTPLDALWSAAVALLISGAISLVVLDRQRGRMGAVAGGFFARMNARIDAAARAEDIDDLPETSRDGDQQPQHESVDEHEGAGGLERRDQARASRASEDDPQG